MGRDCFKKAHGEYSDYIKHFVGEAVSLTWKLCRCYGAYCPNQTKEELEKVIRGIVSTFEVEYGEHAIAAIVSYGLTILIGTVGKCTGYRRHCYQEGYAFGCVHLCISLCL